jgi:hypothetical protein
MARSTPRRLPSSSPRAASRGRCGRRYSTVSRAP